MFKTDFLKMLSELRKTPIFKSILVLVSGTGIAQLMPLITAPIVARLYSPVDFGTYAIFYSLVTIFIGMASLEYSHVIIVANSNENAILGIVLASLVTFMFTLFLLILILILPESLLMKLFGKEILPFLWVIPVTVFFSSINYLLYTWFLRIGKFKLLSINKIVLSVCAVVIQIGIGFLYLGAKGFIVANLISILISSILLAIKFKPSIHFMQIKVSFDSLKSIAYEYRKFPLVSVWGNTLNIITLQIPQFLLNKIFDARVLGQYALAQRIISLPLGFVSSAIQDAFIQGASKENNENGNCIKSYKNTLKISSMVSFILLISCLTFVAPLFVFVFGPKWADSGIYVRVLALLFAVRFVVGPLSYTFYIKAKQHIDFLWQVGLFILTMITLYGGYYWIEIKDPIYLLLFYAICLSLWYFINFWITYNIAKKIKN